MDQMQGCVLVRAGVTAEMGEALNHCVPLQGMNWSRFVPAYTEMWPGSCISPCSLSRW